MDKNLVGTWISDDSAKNEIGNVTMTFTEEGNLTYDVQENDKVQKIFLTYELSGDTLISNQPSHPQKQFTKYVIVDSSKLILIFDGVETKFNRQK